MLSSKNTVALPESGIIVRRTGKYNYVYKVLRAFRNEKGQPTNTRKLIGRLNADGDRLVPNDSYYELYGPDTNTEFTPEVQSDVSVGVPLLMENILTRLGAKKVLEEVFGSRRACEVVTAASYMASEGCVFEYVSDWCERSMLGGSPLSPQKASSLFASVTHDERMKFFKGWVTANAQHDYLAYDVTSFSSYAEGVKDLEWGYNRDGEKLPQFNLGCYLSQERRMPMFYVTYPGSIVDKAHFPYMMAYNDELGIGDDIVFILDKGFCATPNVNLMHSKGIHYIMSVDARHKTTLAAIDSVRDEIHLLQNMIGKGLYAVKVRSRFYGETSDMHVYYNHELVEPQRCDLIKLVENTENELAQLKEITSKQLKRYSRFFDIKTNDDKILSFERNYEKINAAAKNNGIFCILTNTSKSSLEVLSIYRNKDTIEKGFDDVKNHLDMKRIRAHTEATISGKVFCAFIGLIVASEMANGLSEYNATHKERTLSKRGLVWELEKIKVYITPNGRRLLNPLTKKQRELLETFKISEADVKAYISNKN